MVKALPKVKVSSAVQALALAAPKARNVYKGRVMEKIATRVSYGKALCELYEKRSDLMVLDSDVAAATMTATFKKAHPDRFFDCGIQEQNMMGVAAGIAATGALVFASSFAMFAAGRAFEIVRNAIGYPHLNVKIGATHAGISVGEDGATHQCNEDIALMRTIPGMTIINPADDTEARAAVLAMAEHVGPAYLRFGRLAVPVINDPATYKFELGKAVTLREGGDVSVIATGLLVSEALDAAEVLAGKGISARVVNIHTIKPLDEAAVIDAAKTGKVLVCEEHSVIGGLYGAVAETLLRAGVSVKADRIGVEDVFGHSGAAPVLLKEFGLSAENIVTKVLGLVNK